MDQELKNRLDTQEQLLKQIYASVEKTRQYFLWIMMISLVLFVLPFIGLLFALPSFISNLTNVTAGL